MEKLQDKLAYYEEKTHVQLNVIFVKLFIEEAQTKPNQFHGRKKVGRTLIMYFIGKKEDLIQAKRTSVTLDGRDILIVYHQRVFYAMDLQCYRE